MKTRALLMVLSFILLGSSAQAKIFETTSIQEVASYVDEGTLVVFDIDNTLLECSQMLGSHEWFCHQMQCLKDKGWETKQALAHVLPIYRDIQHHTTLRLVESEAVDLIRSLQQAGYPVMALTTRDELLADVTKRHLYAYGIDMRLTAPLKQAITLEHEGETSTYQEGVLFTGSACGGAHKGKALWALLAQAHFTPRKIVFINDTLSHLLPVEETTEKHRVEFIGLRYGITDSKAHRYRQDIADVQMEFYKKILSDEVAAVLLQDRQAK